MPIVLSLGVFFNCFERVCVAVEFHRVLLSFKTEISITVSVGSSDIGSISLVIYVSAYVLTLETGFTAYTLLSFTVLVFVFEQALGLGCSGSYMLYQKLWVNKNHAYLDNTYMF